MYIVLSDRPELFYVLSRITEGVTEFINGSNVKSEHSLYKYNFSYWLGIVFR